MGLFSFARRSTGGRVSTTIRGSLRNGDVADLSRALLPPPGVGRLLLDLTGAQLAPGAWAALARILKDSWPRDGVEIIPGEADRLVRALQAFSDTPAADDFAGGQAAAAAAAAPLGIVAVDGDGLVRYANPAAHVALGIPQGGAWPPWSVLAASLGADPVPVVQASGQIARSGSLLAGPWHGPGRAGSAGAIVILPEGLDAAFGEVAAVAAHEIRNPLATIRAGMQLLLGDLGTGASSSVLPGLIQEVDRVSRLLDHYLTMGRPIQLRRVPIVSVLADAVHLLGQQVTNPVAMAIDDRLREVQVTADPAKLRQAVLNLALNAAQAGGEEGGIRVNASVVADGRELCIRVHDQGPGFPDDVVGAPQGLQRGVPPDVNGLGLFVARYVAESHGGRLELRNTQDGGAEARLYLPLRPQPDSEVA